MTELIWEGKYDAQGRKVAPPRIALPFQTVETVNESAADRDRMQDLFASGRPTEWRNRLIWGDKKYVLPSLLDEFAGKVNLVYIDPPFDTGANFSYNATIPDDPDTDGDESTTFVKQPSVIEQKAYRDTWGRGMQSYVAWLYETVVLLRDLLADDGSIYLHLDEHADHYGRVILDEVFGAEAFRSAIAWKSTSAHSDSGRYGSNHQTILFYTKGNSWTWNNPRMEYDPLYVEQYYRYKEPSGRLFKSGDLSAYGLQGGGYTYEWHGHKKLWRVPPETMKRLHDEGRIFYTKNGVARLKGYLDETDGMPAQTIWADKAVQYVVSWGQEKLPYDTQKSEGLLKRIIEASSDAGDLVLDSFSGSGTTAAVAEKLNRRWITCDLGRFAIHTTRKRLLGIPGVKPFVVQNLGKYERQAWQAAEFGDSAEAATQSYRQFVLELYHAEPIAGYVWLHGSRRGRMVHVGGVDAPVTRADVTGIVTEFRKAIGRGKDAPKRSGVDVLGWDFAFELNETARQEAELAGIDLKLIRIPRELLEKKAVEQGDIKFFELAALGVSVKKKARSVTLELTDFMIPLDDVPEDVQRAVTHWEQWIDYWAVDWDNSDDTFHNEWQAYRTRKDKTLERRTTHTYPEPGTYRVVVKVIDILGNDTTKVVPVEVR
jgi:adenine-specific DNA-methyltransferase